MPEIGTSGSMSGDGNGALPNGPSCRAHPQGPLIAADRGCPLNRGYRGISGQHMLNASSSHFDQLGHQGDLRPTYGSSNRQFAHHENACPYWSDACRRGYAQLRSCLGLAA